MFDFYKNPINVSMKTISMIGCFIFRLMLLYCFVMIENIEHWINILFSICFPGIYWFLQYDSLTIYTWYAGILYITSSLLYFVISIHHYYKLNLEERKEFIVKQLQQLKNAERLDVTPEEWDTLLLMPTKKLEAWYIQYAKSKGWSMKEKE